MLSRIFCLFVFYIPSVVFAQTDSAAAPSFKYYNSFLSGGLIGKDDYGTTLSLSINHGVRLHKVGFALGAGYDQYLQWKSLPVFAKASYDLFTLKSNAFFVELNGGYAWTKRLVSDNDALNYSNGGGIILNPMVGYRINAGKFSLYLTGGYKYQRNRYEESPRWWIWGYPGASKSSVQQDMSRLCLQLGIGLH